MGQGDEVLRGFTGVFWCKLIGVAVVQNGVGMAQRKNKRGALAGSERSS